MHFQRLCLPAAVAFSAWVFAPGVSAGPMEIGGSVHCPVLGGELAAELKARAIVDLSLRAKGPAEFDVVCDGWRALAGFRLRSGGSAERVIAEVVEARSLVDAILVALGEAAVQAASSPLPSAIESERVAAPATELASRTPAEDSRAVPLITDVVRPLETPEPVRIEETGPSSVRPDAFALLLGAGSELLGGDPAVATRLGVTVGWPSHIWMSLGADYAQGLSAGRIATVREIGGTLTMSAWLRGGRFEFGTGVYLGSIVVSAPGYTPPEQSSLLLAAVMRARYGFNVQGLRFAVGPEIRLHAFPTNVAVNGVPEDSVPWLTPAIELEMHARFDGRPW